MTALASQREFHFTQQDFDFLRRLANQHTGIVVSDDKFDMFYSRLSRRVRALGLPDFAAYCNYLKLGDDEAELTELVNAITTNLTAFFRENHHFEYLRDHALPERMRVNGDRRISIWSAGCSTGEEPYSIGMVVGEMASLQGWEVDITATDIDSDVLAKASRGIYRMDRVEGLPRERLRRWFFKGKGHQKGMVRVKPELRQRISFRQLNLMQPWQQEPMEIIFCRNVIIYFDKESKIRLVERFADVIKPGGFLFIGHSESLFKATDRFELIGKTIYRRVK
ncbi:CheR family methyltransferase [endosymbiont of unidentified scaly snail isolate Monju]|uniref:CheR family methyltransferase n=1 Tax=endosymbiont of unidentified scaly snail isolate Monju TaxID=1248727 RepID=UPI0003891FCD|nr:protein-glutamate O-methyltransferase CheR [endosymbiont of unidentified scaly snail isolate Monju]BAN69880.1 chemotaxis protein methyltransferase CheR [endosymbiont of unidentified scaly snail isolate Monju]